MNEAKQESPAPKRGRWMKILILAAGGLLVVLVAVYFVVTSGGFVKGVVLPKDSSRVRGDSQSFYAG